MVKNKNIGIALFVAAALALLFLTPLGNGLLGGKDGESFFDSNDRELSCEVNLDGDSVKSAVCDEVDTCRFGGYLGFLIDEDVTVRLAHNGRTIDSEKLDTDFGFDETTTLTGCVPENAQSVKIQLFNEGGQLVDSKEVTLA